VVKKVERLVEKGKRIDGRALDELRPIEMAVGVIERADGSARVRFGNTEVLVAVYGPRTLHPAHLRELTTGILRCHYRMAPFSVEERVSPGPSRRSTEISKVTRLAIEPVLCLEEFPKTTIDVFIEVVQADGSTRVVGINAASLALAAAGIPMLDLVTACSVGKIDGKLAVDMNGLEDNLGEADVAFAMAPRKGQITLLQMDGLLTASEIKRLVHMAADACRQIYELQKRALRRISGVS
jgi:exosome complex component RRP41